jgi:hypothetical protein
MFIYSSYHGSELFGELINISLYAPYEQGPIEALYWRTKHVNLIGLFWLKRFFKYMERMQIHWAGECGVSILGQKILMKCS